MRKKQLIFVLAFVLVTVYGGCGRADVNVENIESTQSPEPEDSKAEEKEKSQEEDTQTGKETVEDNTNQDVIAEDSKEEKKEKNQQPEASENPKKEDSKNTPVSDSSAKNNTENKDKNKNSSKSENNSKNKNSNSGKSNNKNKNSSKENSKESTKDKRKDQIETPDKKETKDPKTVLENALAAVKAALGDKYKPNTAIDSEWLLNVCGIEKEWYDAMAGEQPMISTNVDTYISIHAANGNAKKIAKALKEYRRYLIEDSMQYPMNQPKVEACKVMAKGDYVFFVMLGALEDEDLDKEEADQKALYEAMNQTALDAIEGVIP